MNKPKENPEEKVDASTDREQGLSNQFEDLPMDELLPDLPIDTDGSGDLIAEAASAVQELVTEVHAGRGSEFDAAAEHFAVDAGGSETATLAAKVELSRALFELVSCERPFNGLAEGILSALVTATGAQAGSILELDHEKSEYFFRACQGGGEPEKIKAFRVPMDKGIVGHVGESRQPLLLKNLDSDDRQLRAISMSVGFEAKSCLAAPILVANQLYGVVELFNKMPGDSFDERDLHVLEEGMKMVSKVLEVRFLTAELARRAG